MLISVQFAIGSNFLPSEISTLDPMSTFFKNRTTVRRANLGTLSYRGCIEKVLIFIKKCMH